MQYITTPHKQRGATMLGMLVIGAILALALYSVIRLTPVYLEYFAVVRAMQQTAAEVAKDGGGIDKIKFGLNRRWNIEDIKTVGWDDIEVHKSENGFSLTADYRAEVPFIANVSWVVDFDKTIETQ